MMKLSTLQSWRRKANKFKKFRNLLKEEYTETMDWLPNADGDPFWVRISLLKEVPSLGSPTQLTETKPVRPTLKRIQLLK